MKQRIISKIEDIETMRSAERKDMKQLECIIHEIEELVHEMPSHNGSCELNESDLSSIMENFVISSDGKLRSVRSSPVPLNILSHTNGNSIFINE